MSFFLGWEYRCDKRFRVFTSLYSFVTLHNGGKQFGSKLLVFFAIQFCCTGRSKQKWCKFSTFNSILNFQSIFRKWNLEGKLNGCNRKKIKLSDQWCVIVDEIEQETHSVVVMPRRYRSFFMAIEELLLTLNLNDFVTLIVKRVRNKWNCVNPFIWKCQLFFLCCCLGCCCSCCCGL